MPRPDLEDVLSAYDKFMFNPVHQAYYGHSDFYNYGYWGDGATSQKEACEALVEKLVSFIDDKRGKILDVACGLGASTRQLLKYYDAANVVAINLSEVQLERARENAPGVDFRYMDAVHLDFPDNSFENIICVESAHHFRTRDVFYKQAFRVLKPGGKLVTSDITGPKSVWQENALVDDKDLASHLEEAGFEDVVVEEVTEDTWKAFSRHLLRWPAAARRRGEINWRQFISVWLFSRLYVPVTGIGVKRYCLTSARKPPVVEEATPPQDSAAASEN